MLNMTGTTQSVNWYINPKNMKEIKKWLGTADLRTKKVY
mgnify:CR=1 FL=1